MKEETSERGESVASTEQTIRSLNEQLSDPTLKSSTRILILILLTMNRKLGSVELRSLVGLGKGSLENHIGKLEAAGYVRILNVRSFSGSGRRQIIEITPKGIEDCKALLQRIQSLGV